MNEKITAAVNSLIHPLLGFEKTQVEELSKGHAVLSIELTEGAHNALGNVHGGFLFTLCDTASGAVSASESRVSVTLDSNIHYLKGVKQGRLRIEARSIHCGRTTLVVETKITNEEGELIAAGTFTMYKIGDL